MTTTIEKTPRSFVYGLQFLQGRWVPHVIHTLYEHRTLTYLELQRLLEPVSNTMLTKALKELEEAGITEVAEKASRPYHYRWRLTKKGEALIPVFHFLCRWSFVYAPRGTHTIAVSPVCTSCSVRSGFKNPIDCRTCPCHLAPLPFPKNDT